MKNYKVQYKLPDNKIITKTYKNVSTKTLETYIDIYKSLTNSTFIDKKEF